MTPCPNRYDGDGLPCTLDAGHPWGHVYVSGSHVDDRHEEGGHG